LGPKPEGTDANESLTETFTYDTLNRLTQTQVNQTLTKAFTYDPIGNLLSKSDVGNYTYPLAGAGRPHSVLTITPNPPNGGSISTSFVYDNNGNQTAGLGRSISYTSYNKPSSITQGSSTLFFSDDIDHQRFKQQAPEGTMLYFDAFSVHPQQRQETPLPTARMSRKTGEFPQPAGNRNCAGVRGGPGRNTL
jgi:YD repeat-containing protein